MSHDYKAVQWTAFKKRYDFWMLAGIATYLTAFVFVSVIAQPLPHALHPVQIVIRATGTLAFLMLNFILCIGPLARMTPRFKPFLYNRRHLGVTTFFIALIHAGLVTLWYHGFSDLNPFVSLLVSNPNYDSLAGFPFESLGLVALIILFVMAATSHDFWNANLGPGFWKALHMGVYLAYGLLVAHIALGGLQSEKHPAYVILLALSCIGIAGLHIASSRFGRAIHPQGLDDPRRVDHVWLKVGMVDDIEDLRAKIIQPENGEAIAVFRHGNKVFAVSNVCRHQGGPLGEGKIVDGCITCPWHGFQYRPEDGQSPAPFTEKIATYATKIMDGVVYVSGEASLPGTAQSPSIIGARDSAT